MAVIILEQMALNIDTSNLLIAMSVLAAAGRLGGFFPPLVMGVTYEAAANNYFKIGDALVCDGCRQRGMTLLVCGGKKSFAVP